MLLPGVINVENLVTYKQARKRFLGEWHCNSVVHVSSTTKLEEAPK
jgi:hypothetical protein